MSPNLAISSRGEVIARTIKRLRAEGVEEQLSFAFASVTVTEVGVMFECLDERVVQPHEFEHQSWCHIELGDEARTEILRTAHQRQLALVEFHSHTFDAPACFSASDWSGFEEFVPYVWWRLRRPYAAVVVGPNSLDALAWVQGPKDVRAVGVVGGIACTNLSMKRMGVL